MKTITFTVVTLIASLLLSTLAIADEITFTSLPQTVQTTVIRETHISSPAGVTRVIRESNGIYAVTVRENTGSRVFYVSPSGSLVQEPTNGTILVQEPTNGTVVTTQEHQPQTVTILQEMQQTPSRYELIKKEGNKEIYLDHQTGRRVKIERD
jgi:hypothetical protein